MVSLAMQHLGELVLYLFVILGVFYVLDGIRAAVVTYVLVPRLLRRVDQLLVDADADNPRWDRLRRQAKKYDQFVGEDYHLEQIVTEMQAVRRKLDEHGQFLVFPRKRA